MVKKILALDGGGSKGVITLQFLLEIENCTGKNIGELFDLIVGTSAGSIITVALNYPDDSGGFYYKSVSDIINLFFELVPDIFSRSLWHKMTTLYGLIGPKYESKNIDKLLDQYFGDIKLNELKNQTLITTAMIEPNVKYFEFDSTGKYSETLATYATRCSISAPTFFNANTANIDNTEYEFIDGGIGVNNPTLAGYFQAKKIWNDEEIIIVSIGTGYLEKSGIDEKDSGLLQWAVPISDIMIEDTESFADFQIKKLLQLGKEYFRLNVPLTKQESKIDETDPNKLRDLMDKVSLVLDNDKNKAAFEEMCEILVNTD